MKDLVVSACAFPGARSNQPKNFEVTWGVLCENLRQAHPLKPGLPLAEAKLQTPAISAAVYRPGTTRSRQNIDFIQMVIFDFDNKKEESSVTMPQVAEHLRNQNIGFFSYFTFSSTPEHHRFRVIVPLAQRVYANFEDDYDWDLFTEWVLDRLGLNQWREAIDIEKHLKNPAALSFLQANPNPANLGFYDFPLAPLSWSVEEVDAFALTSMPEHFLEQEKGQEHRSQGKDFSWMEAYNLDFATLDLPALLRAQGLWVSNPKPTQRGYKFECHCPFAPLPMSTTIKARGMPA